MTLPPPEICQRILALHLLLGFPNGKDEKRLELFKLLGDCGLAWSSLPEFFADMRVSTPTPLPAVGSKSWEKRCQKVCQLHAAMGSVDNDGPIAHKKLTEWLAKQQFNWANDLPAILAADWVHKNPSNVASPASADMPNDFTVLDLALALSEDYLVQTETHRLVTALWALHTHIYDSFEYTPRLALISPDSGYGKTRTLRVLQQLALEAKLTKNTTAAAMARRLERRPRMTYLLDEGENQPILTDPVMRAVLDAGYERGDGTIDRVDFEASVFFPCAFAIRGSEYDVPVSIRSRSFSLQMLKATPKKRFDERDPACMAAFAAASNFIRDWAATTPLNLDPEIPRVLLRNSRIADNCRPLLAVADTFGEKLGEAARVALIELCAGFRNLGPRHRALNACKVVCDTMGEIDRIDGKVLTEAVMEEDDYFVDWRGANDRGQPHKLTPPELSRLLKDFGVRSKPMWPIPRKKDSKGFRGYYVVKIYEAWRIHCAEGDTSTHVNKIIALAKS